MEKWCGIDTNFIFASGERDHLQDYQRQSELISMVKKAACDVVVLPETAAGRWTKPNQTLWNKALAGVKEKIVITGAEILNKTGYENVLLQLGNTGKILYLQRMPAPFTMWRFWDKTGCKAYWFENPVVDLNQHKIAPLICYEVFLVYPVLQSMLYKPDIVVAVGNMWWAKKTNIPALFKCYAQAWARLFDKSLVSAVNL